MAAYLELTDRTTGKVYSGQALIELDSEIAATLGIPTDPIEWTLNWMNGIGFALATGESFTSIRESFTASKGSHDLCLKLIDYLDQRFENTSFISR